jgi:hypothetical protein
MLDEDERAHLHVQVATRLGARGRTALVGLELVGAFVAAVAAGDEQRSEQYE